MKRSQPSVRQLRPTSFREFRVDPDVRLVTVDIFDTLVLRRPISERRRHHMVTRTALADPRVRAVAPAARLVCRARAVVQNLTYRELDVSGRGGEARLADIVRHQLALLALPEDLAPAFLAAEVTVETRALLPNRALIEVLARMRRRGIRVVGLSDTTLSRSQLMSVIDAVAGKGVLDALYTSSDLQATKRMGDAFKAVCRLEGVDEGAAHHLGDDAVADWRAPASQGIRATCVPRSTAHLVRRRLDAAGFLIEQRLGRHRPGASNAIKTNPFGPIVADFCMRLWLYLSSIPNPDDAVVLFCARGGLNMHVAFKRFVERLGLPLPVACHDIMLSRLAVIRGPLLAGDEAALEELDREFADSTLSDAALALAGSDFSFEAEWLQSFNSRSFMRLMRTTATGAKVRNALSEQADLFTEHLASLSKRAHRLVLCDTGLYGSTMRLLQAGYPQYAWECLLFARRNYKGFAEPHFAKTAGLSVQSEAYNPFDARTSVLRYWQLIESLFEPELPSVKAFHKSPDGTVMSNLEVQGWHRALETHRPAFAAVMDYLSLLDRDHWFERVNQDCDSAWRVLRSTILFPALDDNQRLDIRMPTRDLGRDVVASAGGLSTGRGLRHQIDAVRSAHWREGCIAAVFPNARWPLQIGIEAVYAIKFGMALLRRRELRWRSLPKHPPAQAASSTSLVAGS